MNISEFQIQYFFREVTKCQHRLDLDGTLLDPSGALPLDTRLALQRARRHVRCCVATGRNPAAVASLALEGATGVYLNGALALVDGEQVRNTMQDVLRLCLLLNLQEFGLSRFHGQNTM